MSCANVFSKKVFYLVLVAVFMLSSLSSVAAKENTTSFQLLSYNEEVIERDDYEVTITTEEIKGDLEEYINQLREEGRHIIQLDHTIEEGEITPQIKVGNNMDYTVFGYMKNEFAHVSSFGDGKLSAKWGGLAGFTVSGTNISQIASGSGTASTVTDRLVKNRIQVKVYGINGKDNIVTATYDYKASVWDQLATFNYNENASAIVFYMEIFAGCDYQYRVNGSIVEGTHWSNVTAD